MSTAVGFLLVSACNLIWCRPKLRQNETGLPNHNPKKPTPAWLGGAMRCRHATTQNMLFGGFSHVHSQDTKNGTIFVDIDIEGWLPYLSKLSYGAPQRALTARLMQKERPKITQAIAVLGRKPGLLGNASWSFWWFGAKQAIRVFLASHFRARADLQQQKHAGGA